MVRRDRTEPDDGAAFDRMFSDADRPGADSSGIRAPDDEPIDADEALDREFGLDPHVVAPRTRKQLVRTVVLTTGITIVAAAVVAGTLFVTIQSVQNGIGGLFPQPGATLDRFESHAVALPGVESSEDLEQRQTQIFSGYDVVALVTADATLSDDDQGTLVTALSDTAKQDSGNGVQVLARLRFDDLTVGVSADAELSRHRLTAGQQVAAMGGVDAVSLMWRTPGTAAVDDTGKQQIARVTTTVGDDQIAAVTADVTSAVHAQLPDAQVIVVRAGS